MVALAQSTSASLKVTRAPASGRVHAHQPKPATADSRLTLASSFSIAQQNRSLLHRAATTLQPNVASRYHCNQQYSITAITGSTGAVQERYAYTAYGVPTITNASGTVLTASAISNRYTYTGREWDNDIKQYHYRARIYDASLGRFCGRDPIGYEGSLWNLSEFCLSRPPAFVDPTGLLYMFPPPIGHWQGGTYYPWKLPWVVLPGHPGNPAGPPNYHARARDELRIRLQGACTGCDSCNFDRTKCDYQQCLSDANNIALAIYNTLESNSKFTLPCSYDDRYRGHYCFEWAFAFQLAFKNSVGSSKCFSSTLNMSQVPNNESWWQYCFGEDVHLWIEITSLCSNRVVYVDDSFSVEPIGRTFVHTECPDCSEWGYQQCGVYWPSTNCNSCIPYSCGNHPIDPKSFPWVFPRSK
jgi:RHS repeat-associated protein